MYKFFKIEQILAMCPYSYKENSKTSEIPTIIKNEFETKCMQKIRVSLFLIFGIFEHFENIFAVSIPKQSVNVG